jgi:two-component system, OmpR family, alkaline phosphatase synthesis response regulator PhoP
MQRIQIIEDDRDIAELVRRYLEKAGFTVEVNASGRDGLAALNARPPDLLVLDLMLPHLSGAEICRAARATPATALIPIIMLTARAEEAERIAGLEIGADDYIAKPFSPNELVARVRALLRRAARSQTPTASVAYGPIIIDTERHTVESNGEPVTLTAKECLLLTDVWGYKYTGGTRTVDVHVRRLREKLQPLEDALVTVKQFGYKLLEEPPKVRSG